MINLTYHLARSIEFVSAAIGVGEFISMDSELLCSTCASPPPSPYEPHSPLFFLSEPDSSSASENDLCSTCQSAYLSHLSTSPFSAGFTRRLNICLGVSCLLLGFLAAVGNASEGWWVQGGVVECAVNHFRSLIPSALSTEAVRIILIYVLTTIYLLALTTLLCNILLATFVLALSPLSQTVSEGEDEIKGDDEDEDESTGKSMMWVIYLTQGCFTMALLATVYTLGLFASAETVFVWFPLVVGLLALGCAAFCGASGCESVGKEDLRVSENDRFVVDVKVGLESGLRVEDMV